MVQRVEVQLVDDLEPDIVADVTCTFALNGVAYEIDLSSEHAQWLEDALTLYIEAGRRIGGRRQPPRRHLSAVPEVQSKPNPASQSRPVEGSPAEIRAWAVEQGLDVTRRGRIPQSIASQYQQYHGGNQA